MNVTLGLLLTAFQSTEWPRIFVAVHCPHGHSEQIVKLGTTNRAEVVQMIQLI
jgi:hypothetical protein